MIGLALHLAARGLDTVRAEMAEARSLLGWGLAFVALGRGTPDPSEVDQLGAECDALRKERDEARAQREEWKQNAVDAAQRDLGHLIERDDARTLAHEAKLEFSAAREACEQLRGELADWRGIAASEQREAAEVRAQLDELRAAARDLLAVADRSAIRCSSCSNAAAAVDKTYAYCDEHMPPNQGQLRELSYAAAMRRGRALLPEVKP